MYSLLQKIQLNGEYGIYKIYSCVAVIRHQLTLSLEKITN